MLKRTLGELRIRSCNFSQIGQELTPKGRQQNLKNLVGRKTRKNFQQATGAARYEGAQKWQQILDKKCARNFAGGAIFAPLLMGFLYKRGTKIRRGANFGARSGGSCFRFFSNSCTPGCPHSLLKMRYIF